MAFSGKILLLNDESRFFTGETITGFIEIQSDAFIQDISLILEGVINVSWDDVDQKNKFGEITYFVQKYQRKEYILQKQIKVAQNIQLEENLKTIPFYFNVPDQLPSSFATTTGFIRYELILAVTNWLGCHRLNTKSIDLQKYYNICRNPFNLLPYTQCYTRSFYSWTCRSNPINVSISLPCMAFVPGESIAYEITIENQTRHINIRRISVILIQIIHYKSLEPNVKMKTEMSSLKYVAHVDPCPCECKNYIQNTISIPSNLVVTSEEQPAFTISYRLQALVILKGLYMHGSLIVPITIGSHRKPCDSDKSEVKDDNVVIIHKTPKSIKNKDHTSYESLNKQIMETMV